MKTAANLLPFLAEIRFPFFNKPDLFLMDLDLFLIVVLFRKQFFFISGS